MAIVKLCMLQKNLEQVIHLMQPVLKVSTFHLNLLKISAPLSILLLNHFRGI